MIDLIIRSPTTQASILTALTAKNLLNADGSKVAGFDYCWWAGSGQVMTSLPVINDQGVVTTPAAFLPGFAMICRIYSSLFTSDNIASPVDSEQWSKSKIAQAIKTAGTLGTIGTPPISFYQVGNFQLCRAADVQAWLAANNLPGHEWAGGNSF